MARVAVIGAGVVGVASAYMLCRAGHDVTLVDRNSGPAQGASFANGAQLSYAYGDALASPALLGKLPAILLDRDPAFRIRIQADPEFFVWGLRFVVNALPGPFRANTHALIEMAAESKTLLADLQADLDLDFDYAPFGKMILYSTEAAANATTGLRALKASFGIQQHVLDRTQATAIEPALDLYPDPIARVIYSPDDAAGRPDAFCAALVERMRARYSLTTLFGQSVTSVLSHNGRVTGVNFAAREPLACDIVIMASGASVDALPGRDRPFGGLWPVQGYSITRKATVGAMRISITDLKRKIVFARLGDEVRVAGLADIGPRCIRFDASRFATFEAEAVAAFGATFRQEVVSGSHVWTGARPCTPSSQPIIRHGSLEGLFLNLGHGTLGWTLCLGSAAALVRLVEG